MSKRVWGAIGAVVAAIVIVVVVLVAGGDSDDGSSVRTIGCDLSSSESGSAPASGSPSASGSVSGSASGSASASECASDSGSASGSGLSSEDIGSGTDDPVLQAAVEEYRSYVTAQVADTVAKTTVFTDAVRSGDLAAAQAAYAPSRVGWESIEPIAGLVADIDGAVDARVDDFAGVTDPDFTGWHRLEYLLFSSNTTDGAAPFADKLDADLATLQSEIGDLDITPLAMARGAAELVEEVSEGKITGEEDRYSHTDLVDFAANIAGAEKVVALLTPALEKEDPDLLAEINGQFAKVDAGLAKYATGDGGYQSFTALTAADTTTLKAALGALSEELAEVPGALGLK